MSYRTKEAHVGIKKPSSNALSPEAERTEPAIPAFEESIRRLGEIVETLEAGDLPLEQSLKLFEEGVRLARLSQSTLDRAEKRVEELLGVDEEGNPIVRDLTPEAD